MTIECTCSQESTKPRFKQPVVPGDCIQIGLAQFRRIRDIWKTAAEAKVGDVVVCSAELLFTFQEL